VHVTSCLHTEIIPKSFGTRFIAEGGKQQAYVDAIIDEVLEIHDMGENPEFLTRWGSNSTIAIARRERKEGKEGKAGKEGKEEASG
jgi:hypothetical protein